MPKFHEMIDAEALAELFKLQWNTYGTQLDIETVKQQPVNIEPTYPSLLQIDKDMRKVIGEISPIKTKGVGIDH